jgi:hypothetical protein
MKSHTVHLPMNMPAWMDFVTYPACRGRATPR